MSYFPIHWRIVSKINIKVLEKENNYKYMTRDVRTCESAVSYMYTAPPHTELR